MPKTARERPEKAGKEESKTERERLQRIVHEMQKDWRGALRAGEKAGETYRFIEIATAERGRFLYTVYHTGDSGLMIGADFKVDDENLCSISMYVRYVGDLPMGGNQDPLLIGPNEAAELEVYNHVTRVTKGAPDGTPVAFIARIQKFADHKASAETPGICMRLLRELLCELAHIGIMHKHSYVVVHRGMLAYAKQHHDDAKLHQVYTKAGFSDIESTRGMTTRVSQLCQTRDKKRDKKRDEGRSKESPCTLQ
jgi:hypothetical protein